MKKTVLKWAAVCTGALIMTSCGSNKNMAALSSLEGEWNIIEVGGQKVQGEEAPFIGFDVAKKRIYGSSGCNRMMGGFETDSLKPGTLSFGKVGSTMMMCPDMTTEKQVLKALSEIKHFAVKKDGQVTLLDENNDVLLLLEKK